MGVVEGGILAYAAAASAVVGTAVSVYSAQEQKKDANALADRQAQQAKDDAAYAASEAQVQARVIRKAADRQRAEARASLAGSGVVVGTGTAEQIDAEIQADSEQDALMAIYDGGNRARGINQAGQNAAARSRSTASAAGINAWSSALSGGASIARGWNTTRKT